VTSKYLFLHKIKKILNVIDDYSNEYTLLNAMIGRKITVRFDSDWKNADEILIARKMSNSIFMKNYEIKRFLKEYI